MKKYLMRSGINPLEYKTPQDLLGRDYIGTNLGNLIYVYGIFRNLSSEETQIYSDHYGSLDPVQINKEYDGYIIALADAIRPDFVGQLKQMTKLIKQLTIPVYLIGMGVRAPYNVDPMTLHFDFDDTVREFIRAILEKSAIVGLRGQITAQYLTNLGFVEGRDHMAIGCPSMYSFGPHLSIKDPVTISTDSLITTNLSKPASAAIKSYIHNIHVQYPNATFLPQGYDEFKLVYSGSSVFNSKGYPSSLDDIEYSSGNPKFFLNAPTWINYMKTVDLSFGTKLHGNIVATIAGTPSITIPLDARMKELIDYHDLPFLLPKDIGPKDSLQTLVNKVDFHSPEKKQRENYERFVDFLKKNGLSPVSQEDGDQVFADKLLAKTSLYPVIESSLAANSDERLHRMMALNAGNFEKETKLRKQISNSHARISTVTKSAEAAKRDAKAVKAELKLVENSLAVARKTMKSNFLKSIGFDESSATVAQLNHFSDESVDKPLVEDLATGSYLYDHKNVLITGNSGSGKTWIAAVLGLAASDQLYTVNYIRSQDLLGILTARIDSVKQPLMQEGLLVIDDWLLSPIDIQEAAKLNDFLKDTRKTIVICSPVAVEKWQARIEDDYLANSIVLHLTKDAYRVDIK